MASQDTANLPDVLGTITNGQRVDLDVIQCALAIRPPQIAAGHTVELIALLQNVMDIDIDVVVCPRLPERDTNKTKGCFVPKSSRVLVGLRPAEVGFVSVPVATAVQTAPASTYLVGVDLDIKRLAKKPNRVRRPEGGGSFRLEDLEPDAQDHIRALRELNFSTQTGGRKNYVQAVLTVRPPDATAQNELKPEWKSLWTMRDHTDIYATAAQVYAPAQIALAQLRREQVFMPLLKTTQERFKAGGYPLLVPEAVFITKLLTLILETGVAEPSPVDPRPVWPRWYIRLCRLLIDEPALAGQVELLVTRLLYDDLIHDGVIVGFGMVTSATHEDFGTEEEMAIYAHDLMTTLKENRPLDFAHIYLPLVLAGLIVNARIIMPREQTRETIFSLSKALDQRRSEQNEANAFVFELVHNLIERALDSL